MLLRAIATKRNHVAFNPGGRECALEIGGDLGDRRRPSQRFRSPRRCR
jgi:hypothetical protein